MIGVELSVSSQSTSRSHLRTIYVGKEIPLQPLTGPEFSRRLRLPDFKIIGT
jgi:hypothetical protein